MPRAPRVEQVWQCPTCGYRYTTPLRASKVQCPRDHLRQSRVMKVVWTKGDATPPPIELN